jgi:hypothetical protein
MIQRFSVAKLLERWDNGVQIQECTRHGYVHVSDLFSFLREKVSLGDHHAVCVHMCIPSTTEPTHIFGMNAVPLEATQTTWFLIS